MAIFRLITIMFAALSMGMAFSHLLQLPPRMGFDGPTWITTQQVFALYGSIGGFIEVGSVILAGILAYLVRATPAFGWTLAGAICLGTALITWIAFVAPANGEIMKWTTDSIPENWTRWRMQWEYAHAVRSALLIVGFGFLVQSVLADT